MTPRFLFNSALETPQGKPCQEGSGNRGHMSARKIGQSTPSRSSATGRAQMDKLEVPGVYGMLEHWGEQTAGAVEAAE